MIVLCVSSYNGAPTEPQETSFDELGGSIGRATTNQMVLLDTDRTISRVQAQIVMRNGGFVIVDRGSNPISVNGAPLGNGREAAIKPGDKLNVGGYAIDVRAGHQTVAADPFGDLFGPASAPAPPPMAPPPAPAFPPPRAPAPPAPAFGAGPIPADWDPFAPDAHTTGVRLGSPAATPSDPLGLGAAGPAPMSAGPSVDDLFGLGAPAPNAPLGRLDPLAPPVSQANTAADADPLRALMQPARAPQAAVVDTIPDMRLPWQSMPATPVPTPPAPAGAILSWDASKRENKVITLPDVRPPPPNEHATAVVARPAPAAPAGNADTAALRDALLAGLGQPELPLPALTPAHMRLIGELLREATRGAVELLRARASLKQELRAQVTMIVTRENNPLKFSPTVDVALGHLLGPGAPGFMAPARAMRDTFDDLRAHEIGMMAGMRAALDGVLARFDPQALDGAISQRGGLAALLPGARKAQLWEQFQQLYGQLSREAADDFHALFGKAFLKAYEAQLQALEAER